MPSSAPLLGSAWAHRGEGGRREGAAGSRRGRERSGPVSTHWRGASTHWPGARSRTQSGAQAGQLSNPCTHSAGLTAAQPLPQPPLPPQPLLWASPRGHADLGARSSGYMDLPRVHAYASAYFSQTSSFPRLGEQLCWLPWCERHLSGSHFSYQTTNSNTH